MPSLPNMYRPSANELPCLPDVLQCGRINSLLLQITSPDFQMDAYVGEQYPLFAEQATIYFKCTLLFAGCSPLLENWLPSSSDWLPSCSDDGLCLRMSSPRSSMVNKTERLGINKGSYVTTLLKTNAVSSENRIKPCSTIVCGRLLLPFFYPGFRFTSPGAIDILSLQDRKPCCRICSPVVRMMTYVGERIPQRVRW